MNLIDLLAIAPFFLSAVVFGLEDLEIIGKAGKIIRLLREGVTEGKIFLAFLDELGHSKHRIKV